MRHQARRDELPCLFSVRSGSEFRGGSFEARERRSASAVFAADLTDSDAGACSSDTLTTTRQQQSKDARLAALSLLR